MHGGGRGLWGSAAPHHALCQDVGLVGVLLNALQGAGRLGTAAMLAAHAPVLRAVLDLGNTGSTHEKMPCSLTCFIRCLDVPIPTTWHAA